MIVLVKKKNTYIISLGNEQGYIYGGTFRIGGKKFAKMTRLRIEAKRYSSKAKAVSAGKKLAKSCSNIINHFFVEEEDGFQSWIY